MTRSEFELDAELQARLVLDERPGPAPRLASARAHSMVEAALQAFPAAPARSPVLGSLSRALAVAAALLLAVVFGAAAAFSYHVLQARHVHSPPPDKHAARSPVAPPLAAVTPESVAPAPTGLPVAPAPSANAALHKTNARAPEPALLAPDDLLQTANRLRAEGRFREAAETYGLVYERHPHGLSAYVAEVAAASLELEQLGGPARARRLFERAIAAEPGGALDIEARQGLALAARDLGDARAELAALQGLISAHPRSPAAGRARLRVRELAAKSGY